MSFSKNRPKTIPSSRQLGGGFLSQLRQNVAGRVFAMTLASIPVAPAYASVNPQEDIRDFLNPSLTLPDIPETDTQTEGSGDYMTNEEMQAEYCKDSDPGIQIYFCYMSRISLEEHGHEEFEYLYREFVDTGGDVAYLLKVLQASERMTGFSDGLIPTIITTVFDTHFFSMIPPAEMTVEEREYYTQSYLPEKNKLLQTLPDLSGEFSSESTAGTIEINK